MFSRTLSSKVRGREREREREREGDEVHELNILFRESKEAVKL